MRLLIVFLFSAGSCFQAVAQDANTDWSLLLNTAKPVAGEEKPKTPRIWNPLTVTYRLGLGFYQNVISSQLATNCAFELTCSRYSGTMVKEFGLVKGYFLTFDRISRCTKIAAMETYPVRLNAQGKIKETPEDFHFHRE